MVPRLVLSPIPLEFCNKLLSVLSHRKEIQKCRDAIVEKLREFEFFSVLQKGRKV